MTMVRPGRDDLQVKRDLRRAYLLIGRLRGLTVEESVAALHDHAVLTDVSLHEAALAVLAEWRPPGGSRRQIPASHVYTTSDRTGRVLVRWQGREKAHVAVSGIGSDELAVRLRRAVGPALRAGATHLVIDTRGDHRCDPRIRRRPLLDGPSALGAARHAHRPEPALTRGSPPPVGHRAAGPAPPRAATCRPPAGRRRR